MTLASPIPLTRAEERWTTELNQTRVHFGCGELERLGVRARELDARRVLLVTDRGLAGAGHVEAARRSLAAEVEAVALFDAVPENPSESDVDAGARVALAFAPDTIVALGGGSALDCAKGINFVFTNGGRMRDYWGHGRAERPMLPSIGVPTTAGTGSEAQRYTLITHDETRAKMACGDPKARFRAVLLDPWLLRSIPARVAAATSIDAATHAIESYVSTAASPLSQLFGLDAWRRLSRSMRAFVASPAAADDRVLTDLTLGAFLAGASIELSMLGAAHACANPLTALYGTTHGVAVGLLLPHVVRFNGAGGVDYSALDPAGATSLAERLDGMLEVNALPRRLSDCGVERERLDELARLAATQWTAGFNPVAVGETELKGIYEAAW